MGLAIKLMRRDSLAKIMLGKRLSNLLREMHAVRILGKNRKFAFSSLCVDLVFVYSAIDYYLDITETNDKLQ